VRIFDVQVEFAFRGTVTGHKIDTAGNRVKRSIRRQLKAAGIKDYGCTSVRISEREHPKGYIP
jgi:hypothetical protein